MSRARFVLCVAPAFLAATLSAQPRTEDLRQMSSEFEMLARKVSPSVVKVLVTGYGPVSEDGQRKTAVIARQHSIGSGVIVDSTGYIVTNAHVVDGAQQVRVMLLPASDDRTGTAAAPRGRTVHAKIAGVDKNTDLAVLKIDEDKLPTLPIGDYRKLRQGQLVFAFGSPQGLENTVTMGVVSSVMRQPDPDRPEIYIQTDAAVNPGNSGGPLVDVDGNLVGINTFILSQSGGSEGMGFAIPSVVVRFVYQEILAHGHVHRRHIGINLQAVTAPLAAGLHLPRDSGLIISDVLPGGPADTVGVKVQDVLVGMDGAPIDTVPMFKAALYRKSHGNTVALELMRGSETVTLKVPVAEDQINDLDDIAGLANPEKNLVAGLGIVGIEITPKVAQMIEDLRIPSGVIVAAKAADSSVDTGLEPGDIIHRMNGAPIESLQTLRDAVARLKPGDSVAFQLERDGTLMFLAFEVE